MALQTAVRSWFDFYTMLRKRRCLSR